MSDSVKRYEPYYERSTDNVDMEQVPHGQYVKHSDHKALCAKESQLLSLLTDWQRHYCLTVPPDERSPMTWLLLSKTAEYTGLPLTQPNQAQVENDE